MAKRVGETMTEGQIRLRLEKIQTTLFKITGNIERLKLMLKPDVEE